MTLNQGRMLEYHKDRTMSESILRSGKILQRQKAGLIVIDVQTKILATMHESKQVTDNIVRLIQGVRTLDVPVYYTEQYPKGLGETAAPVKEALTGIVGIQKMSFSCCGAPGLFQEFKKKGLSQLVVCGIECHVCVQQTVLDLMANGFQAYVAANAVSSRRPFDCECALRRMEANGAEITTVESILFELLEVCGTEQFKAILRLVK